MTKINLCIITYRVFNTSAGSMESRLLQKRNSQGGSALVIRESSAELQSMTQPQSLWRQKSCTEQLEGALSNFISWVASLPMAGRMEWEGLYVLSNPTILGFCDWSQAGSICAWYCAGLQEESPSALKAAENNHAYRGKWREWVKENKVTRMGQVFLDTGFMHN